MTTSGHNVGLEEEKPMNDTPRTDAAWKTTPSVYDFIVEMKRIERELNAANDRIKRLEEFARTIENDFDHDEDAHRYGTTCRVCDAEDLLKETKAKEAKL